MARTVLGVYRESVPGERRVALTPPVVERVRDFGLDVVVETSAGDGAGFPEGAYLQAGALVVSHAHLLDAADLLVGVNFPGIDASHRFRSGQILLGLLRPACNAAIMRRWADDGLTALSLDLVPDDLPGVRHLDAAATQQAIAGNRAALLALLHLDRLTHADSTASDADAPPPVRALVVGGGADARQCALALARLGTAIHIWCPDAAAKAPPPGVHTLHLPSGDTVEALAEALPAFDVVVTALRAADFAPVLLSEKAVRALLPGAVVVDLTASPIGGNVKGALPDGVPHPTGAVTLIGAPDLAAGLPAAASAAYATAIEAVLAHLLVSGLPKINPADPFQAATLVTHRRQVVHEATWQRILEAIQLAGTP
jgi:NAD(P) transhydrogenase subunit alpha